MKITVLGNSATQTMQHETTSYFVEAGKERILIDCGPGIVRQLQILGVPFEDITTVVITHCHADHTASYPYLIFSINLAKSMKQDTSFDRVKVIALESVYKAIDQMLTLQYPVEQLAKKNVQAITIPENGNNSIPLNNALIQTFPTKHSVPSIGICILENNKKVSFSGDTVFDESFVQYFKDSELLVYEAFSGDKMRAVAMASGHSTASDAGIMASMANVKKLALCHPLAFMWNMKELLLEEAGINFKGDITMPKEFDVFEI